MHMADIAVVGGGASGLVASIEVARLGASVIIAERNTRLAKKILSTGNGRCNITNRFVTPDRYYGDRAFASCVLSLEDLDKTLNFFKSIGLMCIEEADGKMYPRSLQAATVSDLLREEAARLNINAMTDFQVKSIEKGKKFILSDGNEKIEAAKVILACGGKAAPSMGTDGTAYSLAERLGHRKTALYPSLVQLKAENPMKALKGVKQNCTVTLFVDGKKTRQEYGEVLFTEYGISGPPVFNLSGQASCAVETGKNTEVSIDLADDIAYPDLVCIIEDRLAKFPHFTKENRLNGLLHKKIGYEIVKIANSPREMASKIKDFRTKITGTMGFKNAQVTAGGIATADIDPETCESKITKGLYITGEMLDVDGDCGGFNLQFAWSTGIIAGRSAAKEVKNVFTE